MTDRNIVPFDHDYVRQLENKAFAYDVWQEKTEWVQERIRDFPIASLGKHRADVMREEIDRLWAIHSTGRTS